MGQNRRGRLGADWAATTRGYCAAVSGWPCASNSSPTKNRPSSWLLPCNSGTCRYRPASNALSGDSGSVTPPATGPQDSPDDGSAVKIWAVVLVRMHAAAVAALVQPRLLARAVPCRSAARLLGVGKMHPLSAIAWENRPNAVGEAMFAQTLAPPADSPKIVTLPGSPPNANALPCTQRIAACWSIRP